MSEARPLPPGAVVGILGGGQLGRMLAMAAARLGLKTHIYSPDPESCAFDVARRLTLADYGDEAALDRFVREYAAVERIVRHLHTACPSGFPNRGLDLRIDVQGDDRLTIAQVDRLDIRECRGLDAPQLVGDVL